MIFRRQDNSKPKTMTKFFSTSPVEVLALQRFLEDMSEKGYMLTGAYGSVYTFEECEPMKRRFQVDFFSKASIFDSRPEKNTEDYIEYCKSAGWTHCFGSGKMQFFYTEDMEIPEIETDDDFRFQSIAKAELWSHIPLWVLAIFYTYLGVNNARSISSSYSSWSSYISDPMMIGFAVFFSMYAIGAVISFAGFMTFYLGNKKRLNRGESINLYSPEQSRRRVLYRKIGLGILLSPLIFTTFQSASQWSITLVTLLLFISSAVLFGLFLKSRHSNRKTNIIMLLVLLFAMISLTNIVVLQGPIFDNIVKSGLDSEDGDAVSSESVPVSLKDIGYEFLDEGSVHEETYEEESKSFMASLRTLSTGLYREDRYNQEPVRDEISPFYDVSIFESEFSWIIDRYQALFMKREYLIPESAFPYPEIIAQGYEGYMTKEMEKVFETTRVLLVKDKKAILIISHEPLSEENLLLLLDSIWLL